MKTKIIAFIDIHPLIEQLSKGENIFIDDPAAVKAAMIALTTPELKAAFSSVKGLEFVSGEKPLDNNDQKTVWNAIHFFHGADQNQDYLISILGKRVPMVPRFSAPKPIAPVTIINGAHVDPAGMSYVALPGGDGIAVGSDYQSNNPPHFVNLRPIQIAIYPVTQEQWGPIMGLGTNPSYFVSTEEHIKKAKITDTRQHPVEQVTYEEAYTYCRKLSLRDPNVSAAIKHKFSSLSALDYAAFVIANPEQGLYRLPTDSEMEYAMRAGTTTRYYWGDDLAEVKKYGWTDVDGDAGHTTHPVGQKLQNKFGLYDFIGNVSTLTHDLYNKNAYEEGQHYDNPTGPASGESHIGLRGGSWCDHDVRSAYRSSIAPGFRYYSVGFRLVRT